MLGLAAAGFIIYANAAIFARHLRGIINKRKRLSRKGRLARLIWHALGLLMALSVYDAFRREPNAVKLYRVTLQTPKLQRGTSLSIVQLSDLHLEGYGARETRAVHIVRQVRPDVIFLTGDYLNSQDQKTRGDLRRLVRELDHIAPIYFVPGNWDSDGESVILQQAGAVPIEGRILRIRPGGHEIVLIGAGWYHIRSMPGFGGVMNPKLPHIVLAHMPDGFEKSALLGVDLYLCGHTHGGQVRLPIFGALLPDPGLVAKYQAGLYRLGNSWLYVNRGLGMEGGPISVRFCCRPEVTAINLQGTGGGR